MARTATITVDDKTINLPVTVGTEGEVGLDIAKLRAETGAVTLDPGYGNTGACESAITFIDGDAGILRYRGYPDRAAGGEVQLRRGRLAADVRPAAQRRPSSTASAPGCGPTPTSTSR